MKKTKLISMMMVLSLLLSMGTVQMVFPKESEAKEKKKTYIVKTEDADTYADMKAEMKRKKKEVVKHTQADEEYLKENQLMVISLTEDEAEEMERQDGLTVEEDAALRGSSELIFAEPEEIDMSTLSAEEEYTDHPEEFIPRKAVTSAKEKDEVVPWNISCVAGTPHDNKYKGKKVKVAILDSGIDMHDELNTKQWVDFSDTVNGHKPVDNSGHGTMVAGPIAARISGFGMEGIASEAELYSVKVLDKDNMASVSTIVKALEWCIQNDMDIVNMSFGMDTYSEILAEEVKKAYNSDILMVAAAGNNCWDIQYPARFPEVLSVGSVNAELKTSEFSNNCKTDIVAPGEDVQSTGYLGSYSLASGTSLAAAHVTGVAAAVKSAGKKLTAGQLADILKKSAISLDENGKLVNYENAVALATDKKAVAAVTRDEVEQIADETASDEENYVKGSWSPADWCKSGIGHMSIVNSLTLSYFKGTATEQVNYRNITAEAAQLTDNLEYMSASKSGNYGRNSLGEILNEDDTKMYSPYHAKAEYTLNEVKQHILFLYELARRRIILKAGFSRDATQYIGNSYAGVAIDQNTQRRIVVDLSKMRNAGDMSQKLALVSDKVLGDGYMILGTFLHLVQDLQAHRAKVTKSMIISPAEACYTEDAFGRYASESHMNKDNFLPNLYASLVNNLQGTGMIPIIKIKNYMKKDISFTITVNETQYICEKANQVYEDNPYFYSERFSTAKFFSGYYMRDMLADSGNSTTRTTFYTTSTVPLV